MLSAIFFFCYNKTHLSSVQQTNQALLVYVQPKKPHKEDVVINYFPFFNVEILFLCPLFSFHFFKKDFPQLSLSHITFPIMNVIRYWYWYWQRGQPGRLLRGSQTHWRVSATLSQFLWRQRKSKNCGKTIRSTEISFQTIKLHTLVHYNKSLFSCLLPHHA